MICVIVSVPYHNIIKINRKIKIFFILIKSFEIRPRIIYNQQYHKNQRGGRHGYGVIVGSKPGRGLALVPFRRLRHSLPGAV
jgi:hypothetical protein